LAAGLGWWRAPWAVHDPGKILTDLVVALALGGDCLPDVAVLRARPKLCGPVASGVVVPRLVSALAADAPRAPARARASQSWAASWTVTASCLRMPAALSERRSRSLSRTSVLVWPRTLRRIRLPSGP
jgi:hypothetical protein